MNESEVSAFIHKQSDEVESATRASTRSLSRGLAARAQINSDHYDAILDEQPAALDAALDAFDERLTDTGRDLASLGARVESDGAGMGRDLANDSLVATAPDRLRGIVAEFAGAQAGAAEQVLRFADSPAWLQEIERGWNGLGAIVRSQAHESLRMGLSPYALVKRLQASIDGLPYHAAENLTRTLYIQSLVRAEADRYTEAVGELPITRVIRIAALDPRTCMACLSLHGETIWQRGVNDGEPVKHIIDHHQGRCSTITEYDGDPVFIQSGEQYFRSRPVDAQRAWMGPRKWDAWHAGQIEFADFRQRYDNPLYGEMMREKSLAQIIDDRKRNRAAYNPYTPQSPPRRA